jgi:hypothetical protein
MRTAIELRCCLDGMTLWGMPRGRSPGCCSNRHLGLDRPLPRALPRDIDHDLGRNSIQAGASAALVVRRPPTVSATGELLTLAWPLNFDPFA